MPDNYHLVQITSETWKATCRLCGQSFQSDVKSKARGRVKSHVRDKHGG